MNNTYYTKVVTFVGTRASPIVAFVPSSHATHSRFRARGLLAVTAAGEAASFSRLSSENGSTPNASVRPRERVSADPSAAAARDDGVGGESNPNPATASRARRATPSPRRAPTEAARRRAVASARARESAARADETNAGVAHRSASTAEAFRAARASGPPRAAASAA